MRTIFLALLAALLLVPTAHAAGPVQVIRDCQDDGVLQGDYTASELRSARENLPTDVDEYSDCRDVLSRALAAAVEDDGTSTGGTGGQGGSAGGGGTSGFTGSGGTTGGGTGDSGGGADPPGAVVTPSTPQDFAALGGSEAQGKRSVDIAARGLAPSAAHLDAGVGRNPLPATLIAVLALLAAMTVAMAAPTIRRRALARRQA